jgi:hypothetical protein
MIAEDYTSLNMGVLFFRRTWQSLTLLDLIYETDADVAHSNWEQQALIELIGHAAIVWSLLYIETDPRQFNSLFPGFIGNEHPHGVTYEWTPGDFLCHFAGMRNPSALQAAMRKIHDLLNRDRNGGEKA